MILTSTTHGAPPSRINNLHKTEECARKTISFRINKAGARMATKLHFLRHSKQPSSTHVAARGCELGSDKGACQNCANRAICDFPRASRTSAVGAIESEAWADSSREIGFWQAPRLRVFDALAPRGFFGDAACGSRGRAERQESRDEKMSGETGEDVTREVASANGRDTEIRSELRTSNSELRTCKIPSPEPQSLRFAIMP